jgi:hypothetical protein
MDLCDGDGSSGHVSYRGEASCGGEVDTIFGFEKEEGRFGVDQDRIAGVATQATGHYK